MQLETKIAEPSGEEDGKLRDESLSINWRVMRWFPWPGWDYTNSCYVYCFTCTPLTPSRSFATLRGTQQWNRALPLHSLLFRMFLAKTWLAAQMENLKGVLYVSYELWASPCPFKTKHMCFLTCVSPSKLAPSSIVWWLSGRLTRTSGSKADTLVLSWGKAEERESRLPFMLLLKLPLFHPTTEGQRIIPQDHFIKFCVYFSILFMNRGR